MEQSSIKKLRSAFETFFEELEAVGSLNNQLKAIEDDLITIKGMIRANGAHRTEKIISTEDMIIHQNKVRNALKKICEDLGISVNKMSQIIRCSWTTLDYFMANRAPVSKYTIAKFEKYVRNMGYKLEDEVPNGI